MLAMFGYDVGEKLEKKYFLLRCYLRIDAAHYYIEKVFRCRKKLHSPGLAPVAPMKCGGHIHPLRFVSSIPCFCHMSLCVVSIRIST